MYLHTLPIKNDWNWRLFTRAIASEANVVVPASMKKVLPTSAHENIASISSVVYRLPFVSTDFSLSGGVVENSRGLKSGFDIVRGL